MFGAFFCYYRFLSAFNYYFRQIWIFSGKLVRMFELAGNPKDPTGLFPYPMRFVYSKNRTLN